MLDKTRYFLALLSLVTYPPAFLFWFVVHPWIGFWRRLGTATTYIVTFALMGLIGWGVFRVREPLLAIEYGFRPLLAVLAVVAYGVAVWIEVRCRRHLKLKILVGLPEVSTKSGGGTLLTDGIYGRVRHPRYVSVMFGFLAVALFTNYLAIWVLFLLGFPTVYLLVLVEERELRQRFGQQYEDYARRVPRFMPRGRA